MFIPVIENGVLVLNEQNYTKKYVVHYYGHLLHLNYVDTVNHSKRKAL